MIGYSANNIIRLFVLTVAAFYGFFIRSLGASEQKQKKEKFRFYDVSRASARYFYD